ncbi:MAG: hypothetical protein AB7V55_02515 [Oscillospiraceae bacterium]
METTNMEPAKKKMSLKKWLLIIGAALLAILLAAAAILSVWLYGASSTLSVDINPGFEFEISRVGKVVEVKPVGEEAGILLSGYKMTDKSTDFVMGDVLDLVLATDLVNNEEVYNFLLTVDENLPDEQLGALAEVIISYFEYYEVWAELWLQRVPIGDDAVEQAAVAGTTTGKYLLAKKLANTTGRELSDFTKMSLTQLVNYADNNAIDLGLVDLYEIYYETAMDSSDFDISFGEWEWEDDSDWDDSDWEWEDDSDWEDWDDSDWEWEDDSGWEDWDDSDWVWEDDSDLEWDVEDDEEWVDDEDWADAEYDDESWDDEEWVDEEEEEWVYEAGDDESDAAA